MCIPPPSNENPSLVGNWKVRPHSEPLGCPTSTRCYSRCQRIAMLRLMTRSAIVTEQVDLNTWRGLMYDRSGGE